MKTQKNLGVWMNHATANCIDLKFKKNSCSIVSDFTSDTKEEALGRSEKSMHNERQQMHEAYYKQISEEILKYNHVLLFGPTNAKTELPNYLNKDLHFKDIQIDVEPADKMTDSGRDTFVEKLF